MRKLNVFNHITLDGYFVDSQGEMRWAHRQDPEWNEFVANNAKGESPLLFGRVTYQLMASYWPTPMALQAMPEVAERMNALPKIVFSRTLDEAAWNNTRLIKGDLVAETRKLKEEPGEDIVILGSGSIVSQLAQEGLIDEFQLVLNPLVIGKGRTLFETVSGKRPLKLTGTRTFANGNVVLNYQPGQ
jgi:dihydrofolate reductase